MQDTNHFLKAALQVGPWRVTRKVLLFVVVFCLVIIVFGSLILKTHAFDGRDEDEDWDDDDDDDDDERPISSGDSLMLVLMGLAGMAGLAACAGCLLATPNTPRPLGDSGSVFTLSGVNTHQPVTPRPSAPESVPSQPENNGTVPPSSSTVLPTPTKVMPQGNGYSHSPIFPRNPNYPTEPPPSYSAPSYPAGGQPGRRLARTMPPNVTRAVSSPPTLHTVADLPPPYAPGHSQSLRQ